MRILTYNELRNIGIPYSRVHKSRLVKAGRFPAPLKLDEGRIAWVESEVDDYLASRAAQRVQPKAA